MRILEHINVQQEKLSSGLSLALRICRKIDSSPDSSDVIDFSQAEFVTPTFIIPILVYIKKSRKNISLENVDGYLKSISLSTYGVNSGAMRKLEFMNLNMSII